LFGPYSINNGTIVTQTIQNLVAGNVYSLNIVAQSSTGNVELYAFIPCLSILST
jgi:hypothetical protein